MEARMRTQGEIPFQYKRTLSRREACQYVAGGSMRKFNEMLRAAILPRPIYADIWDRRAIDASLDKMAGIKIDIQSQNESDDVFEAWLKSKHEKTQ